MTLEQLGAGVDFVSDTTPAASDATDGDLYLDTSLSPPQAKVFDANIGSFVRPRVGVDWASKTPDAGEAFDDFFSVNGSGYLIGIYPVSIQTDTDAGVNIDGVKVLDITLTFESEGYTSSPSLLHRFESSFEITVTGADGQCGVAYVLD
jgi:hypothetical protein